MSLHFRTLLIPALLTLLIAGVTSCKNRFAEKSFTRAEEGSTTETDTGQFENYFLELFADSNNPTGTEIKNNSELLIKASASVIRRLTFVKVDSDGKRYTYRLMEELQKRLSAQFPDVQLYASGGIVRTIFSYIYDVIRTEKLRSRSVSTRSILQGLISDQQNLMVQDTPGKILGLGADIDMLLKSPDEARTEKAIEASTKWLNEMTGTLDAPGAAEEIRRLFIARPDVKNYDEQMKLVLDQGGSRLDQLGLDIKSEKILEPGPDTRVIENFLLGRYDFVPPADPKALGQPLATLLRGLRPLPEIAFLSLSKSGQEQVERSMADIFLRMDREGYVPTETEIKIYGRLERNARYFGAKNRFNGAKDGTIERRFWNFSHELSERLHYAEQNFLHEFVDYIPLSKGRRDTKDLPKRFLKKPSDFIRDFTKDGKLYHGTRTISGGLAILRGGFFVSSHLQGQAIYGRGVYMSPDRATAQNYAKSKGMTFELEIDPVEIENANIVYWDEIKDDPWIVELSLKVADPIEALAKDYGIDVIPSTHVLIENAAVIKLPSDLTSVLNSIALSIENNELSNLDRLQLVLSHRNLLRYLSDTSSVAKISDEILRRTVEETITNAERINRRVDDIYALASVEEFDPLRVRSIVEKLLASDDRRTRTAAVKAFGQLSTIHPDDHITKLKQIFLKPGKSSDSFAAAEELVKKSIAAPELLDFVLDHAEAMQFGVFDLIGILETASPGIIKNPNVVKKFLTVAERGIESADIIDSLRYYNPDPALLLPVAEKIYTSGAVMSESRHFSLSASLLALGSTLPQIANFFEEYMRSASSEITWDTVQTVEALGKLKNPSQSLINVTKDLGVRIQTGANSIEEKQFVASVFRTSELLQVRLNLLTEAMPQLCKDLIIHRQEVMPPAMPHQ